jgi:xanthine dehydrogenase molybdenum-binding subunit
MNSKNLSVVGKNVRRIDSEAKVTGEAIFTTDVKIPHMTYAKVIRSPHAHARIKSVDVSEALSAPGVLAAVTHLEIIGKMLHHDILDEYIHSLGEAVAAVAATSEQIAADAAKKIKVEYELQPANLDFDSSMSKNAPLTWASGNLCTPAGTVPLTDDNCTVQWGKGDVEQGFEDSDFVEEMYLRTHAQYHVCLEPHVCVARWNNATKTMDCWLSSQTIYKDQATIAGALGIPNDRVRVISQYIGGGFGGKEDNCDKEYVFAALLSKKIRRPVRYEPTRAEETITAIRHPAQFYYKVGAKKDGSIHSLYMTAVRDGGSHTSEQVPFLLGSTDFVAPAYVVSPNVAYKGWSVFTNTPVSSAYRGFGYFESGCALLQTTDMLAEKLDMDPFDFLYRNVPGRGSIIGVAQGPMTTDGIKKTLQTCADAFDWKKKWHKKQEKVLSDGRRHGIGLGLALGRAYLPNFMCTGNAVIKINLDGKAHLFCGVTDLGQGQATGLLQIAAEAMTLSPDDIMLTWGDTHAPHTNFQAASASTMLSGNAVRKACEDACKKLIELGGQILNCRPEFLTITNGRVHVIANPDNGLTFAQIVSAPGNRVVIGTGHWVVREHEGTPRAIVVCMCEVAVDTETGKTKVLKLQQATDCGQIICRTRVEGQMDGVLSGGMGWVLQEDWAMDKRLDGRIMNCNLYDYRVPTFPDVDGVYAPNIINEDNDPIGPYGARGMGEATLSAAAPAITNAIYNAIGARFSELPITPDKVLKVLGKV